MSTILMPLGVTTLACFFLPGLCVEYVGNLMSGMGCCQIGILHKVAAAMHDVSDTGPVGWLRRKTSCIRLGEHHSGDLRPHLCWLLRQLN